MASQNKCKKATNVRKADAPKKSKAAKRNKVNFADQVAAQAKRDAKHAAQTALMEQHAEHKRLKAAQAEWDAFAASLKGDA